MHLLFGIVAVVGMGCFAGFFLAFQREKRQPGPRNISIYIAQETRPGLHKVAARCYGPLTAIEGGRPTPSPVAPAAKRRLPVLRPVPAQLRPQFQPRYHDHELHHGSA